MNAWPAWMPLTTPEPGLSYCMPPKPPPSPYILEGPSNHATSHAAQRYADLRHSKISTDDTAYNTADRRAKLLVTRLVAAPDSGVILLTLAFRVRCGLHPLIGALDRTDTHFLKSTALLQARIRDVKPCH